jgi:hypothetical protein
MCWDIIFKPFGQESLQILVLKTVVHVEVVNIGFVFDIKRGSAVNKRFSFVTRRGQ